MNLPLFIATHIYGDRQQKRRVSKPAIIIATTGVAIGLAVMIISMSVVIGFKHTVRDKIVGFGSHIQVADFMTLQTAESYPIAMDDSMMQVLASQPGVSHVQRFAQRQGILKTDDDFLGVIFKGVAQEFDTTFVHDNLIDGTIPAFTDSVSSNRIIISKTMADKLRLSVGDKVFAYFVDRNVRTRRFTVAAIYQTNLEQFDNITVFTDLHTCIRLNRWDHDQASGAELTISNFDDLDAVSQQIADSVNRTIDHYGATYSSKNIRELYPAIFGWLDLLDLDVWIILILMIVVSAVTMISGLLIIIIERTAMIGVLKALGARNRTIRHTFLWFAAFITLRALLIGNIIGIGLLILQQQTGFVRLDPQTYYVSTVPVEINPLYILLINIATLLISIIVLIGPSYLISTIRPAKSMRYE